MFFITPARTKSVSNDTPPHPPEAPQQEHDNKRKRLVHQHKYEESQVYDGDDSFDFHRRRVARACDRCRLKKTKCSGGTVCSRCKRDRVVCVTTPSASKRGDINQKPGYTHLVETQRDQLARALYQLLRTPGPTDSNSAKSLLAEMGITTDSIRLPELSQSNKDIEAVDTSRITASDDEQAMSPSSSQFWDVMFNDLSAPQIEAIEMFCAAAPEFRSLLNSTELPLEPYASGELEFDYALATDSQIDVPMSSGQEIAHEVGPQPPPPPPIESSPKDAQDYANSSYLHHGTVDPRSLIGTGMPRGF